MTVCEHHQNDLYIVTGLKEFPWDIRIEPHPKVSGQWIAEQRWGPGPALGGGSSKEEAAIDLLKIAKCLSGAAEREVLDAIRGVCPDR